MPVRLQQCALIMVTFAVDGRLFYLASTFATDELAMRGLRYQQRWNWLISPGTFQSRQQKGFFSTFSNFFSTSNGYTHAV